MTRGSSGEDALVSLMALTLVLAVLCAVFLGKLLLALAQELGRIYLERDPLPARVKKVLWGALIAFITLTTGCIALAAVTASAAPLAIDLVCWGFFGFVLVIETADWWGQKQLGSPTLDSYLSFSSSGSGNLSHRVDTGTAT